MDPNKEIFENAPWKVNSVSLFEDNPVRVGSNLCCEADRLRTFHNWPLDFINPEDLARNGFYYLGRGDEVRCAFCKVEIMRWEKGDDPLKEHQRWAPQCPLLRYPAISGNVPFDSAVTVRMNGPVHPQYASHGARLSTFNDWPKSMRQRPEELAEAGFYYTGQGDKTKCFYCDGGLKDWENHDVPWEEHARWFDRCPYVQLVKGRNYIQKILSEACEIEANETSPPKSKTAIPASFTNRIRYMLFLLLSNTLSDIFLELKHTIVSQGASFGNWILVSMYSLTSRLISLCSRSRSVTLEDWQRLSLHALFLSRIAIGTQIGNSVMHWSFIKRILSLLRVFIMAFI